MKTSFTLIVSMLVATLAGALYGQPQAAFIGPPMSADPSIIASRVVGGGDTIDAGLATLKTDAWPAECDVTRSNFLSCVFREARKRWPMQPTLHAAIWTKVDPALRASRATALKLVCHSLNVGGQRVAFK